MLTQQEAVRQSSITAALDIQGWRHLDAVLLAAMTNEFPVLLIGPHGTAKTLLVERLSYALGLTFRHYNASLLNYDDLVGIPIPEQDNEKLRFITTPGAIWDASFVFFDEISRCRPDLQNKLFPIIHERRVVGMDLTNLRYRWAAMNPPSPDNVDGDGGNNDLYLGSEPLDPALIDRFPYIIPVPNWQDLSRDDQRKMLSLRSYQSPNGSHDTHTFTIEDLVVRCAERVPEVQENYGEWLVDYIIALMDSMEKANLRQSPRRARMLIESIITVHAARLVLEGDDADLSDSAEIALLYGIPHSATEVPPTPAAIVAMHRQAWEITHLMVDEIWRKILQEPDPLQRILLAEEFKTSEDDLSRLVTQALNIDAAESRKVGLATAMFLHFRGEHQLNPAAWEPLAQFGGRVLMPREAALTAAGTAPDMKLFYEIKPVVENRRKSGKVGNLEANYLLGGFPDLWRKDDWQRALRQFTDDLKFFGIDEEALS